MSRTSVANFKIIPRSDLRGIERLRRGRSALRLKTLQDKTIKCERDKGSEAGERRRREHGTQQRAVAWRGASGGEKRMLHLHATEIERMPC
ncbi:hypothetical protein EVAR_74517_1 [Eumeta japonica]|uniref:Uncharacterized protein n=1 Tax=Eumeta variegata TaxID=151549 RepID=A0A4C1TF02_EUMVA|nr:hypothetical protein EVAR_74517_1 [Eumeta japonica]